MDINATAFLRVPARGKDAWIFFLNYGSNREFLPNIPIPGLGYPWEPSDQFSAIITTGVLSLTYKPIEKLTLSAPYVAVRTVDVRLTYQLFRPVRLWIGFDWTNERYLRAERADPDDRLFYYEKRVRAGAIIGLARWLFTDITGGYSFDRFYFEGEGYSDRDQNRVDVDSGPFVQSGWARGSTRRLNRRAGARGRARARSARASPIRRCPSRFQCGVVRERELGGRGGRDHAGAVQARRRARRARAGAPPARVGRAGLAAVGDQEGAHRYAARPRLALHGLDQAEMVAQAEPGARRQCALELARGQAEMAGRDRSGATRGASDARAGPPPRPRPSPAGTAASGRGASDPGATPRRATVRAAGPAVPAEIAHPAGGVDDPPHGLDPDGEPGGVEGQPVEASSVRSFSLAARRTRSGWRSSPRVRR